VRHIPVSRIHITAHARGNVQVLVVDGVLNSTTYRGLRDSMIKAALDGACAVVTDISELNVPTPSALAVFTSAGWQISRWPDVPLLLVCDHTAGRDALMRNGVGRYVGVYPDVASAVDAIESPGMHRVRRRLREALQRDSFAVQRAQDLVIDCLLEWSHQEQIAAGKVIAQELVENALHHTASTPEILVESNGSAVTIAVTDASTRAASLPERTSGGKRSGLELVAELSGAWGYVPSLGGKVVWATIDPTA